MSKFVLLYFKDDERADAWVGTSLFGGARVVGIYQDPHHKPCSCSDFNPKSNMSRNLRFHTKYGWPLHVKCGRISKWHRNGYGKRLFAALGRNLLSENQTPPQLRNPEGFK